MLKNIQKVLKKYPTSAQKSDNKSNQKLDQKLAVKERESEWMLFFEQVGEK